MSDGSEFQVRGSRLKMPALASCFLDSQRAWLELRRKHNYDAFRISCVTSDHWFFCQMLSLQP